MEEKTSEELGFNTDLSSAQEITKDEERHLNAELHTDLIDEEKRAEIVSGGRKIGALIEAVANQNEGGIYNTFKEGIVGIYFDEFRKENQEAFNLLKDEKLSDDRKVQILSILQEQFYKKHGYEGTLPEISLTDQANSFAVDSKNSPDGKERIFISIHQLNDPNSSIASLFGHETGHLNTYDSGEKTANYMQSKIGEDDLSKQFTEREKEEYLKSIGNYYFPSMTMEEQFALASSVPLEDRENDGYSFSISGGGGIATLGAGGTLVEYRIYNSETKEYEVVKAFEGDAGGVFPKDAGFSAAIGYYFINSYSELDGAVSFGGSIDPVKVTKNFKNPFGLTVGLDFIVKDKRIIGIKAYIGKSFKPYDFHFKKGISSEIYSQNFYSHYDYNVKYHPRGGRNSWK